MKTVHTQAIILKRLNFGEADRILTVITKDHGKMSFLAKGVRKSKSKLAGGLELFSVSNVSFIDGKSELKTIVSTQLVRHYGKIVENMQTTMLAYDFLKLIDQHTQDQCEEQFFDLLDSGLQALTDHHEYPTVVSGWFCSQLLGLIGSGVNLERQANGKEFSETDTYQFSFDDMGFFVHPSGQFAPRHIKFLRLLSKVSKPSNLLQVAQADTLASDIKPLLQHALLLAKG